MPSIIHIVAMTKEGTIGVNSNLPFTLAEDLKQFKNLTDNHLVCMGFNTFKSIHDNYLPKDGSFLNGRKVVVVCSDTSKLEARSALYKFQNVTFLPLETTKRLIGHNRQPVIIVGGSKLYSTYTPTVVISTIVDVPEPVASPNTIIHKYPYNLEHYLKMGLGKKTSANNLSYETNIYVS